MFGCVVCVGGGLVSNTCHGFMVYTYYLANVEYKERLEILSMSYNCMQEGVYFFSLCWTIVFRKLSWKYVSSIKRRNAALKWCMGGEALNEDVQAQVIVVPCKDPFRNLVFHEGAMGGASFSDSFQAGQVVSEEHLCSVCVEPCCVCPSLVS